MKGVVLLGQCKCEVRDFPDPVPGPGQVRVKMMATGICGSDMRAYPISREQARERSSRIPGHEPCGNVDLVGEGVKTVKEGDRVTVYHYLGCGRCADCAAGDLMWCRQTRAYGAHVQGSHADYIIADERNCVPLPDSLSFIDGAFAACPGGTAYSSMQKLDVKTGDAVAVFGLGPVGLSGVLLAKAKGCRVLGVDIVDDRVALAKQIGADAAVNARRQDPVEAIRDFTGGEGATAAFEASGSFEARNNIGACLGRRGRGVLVGSGSTERFLDPNQLKSKQLTLMGSFVLPLWMTWEMVDFLDSQKLSFESAVTHRFPLEKAAEAYETFAEGRSGKVIFESR